MPPHLHPRSKLTSSLFATTLFASFFIVALPHILPCPAPRIAYADSNIEISPDGRPRRRRRKCPSKSHPETEIETEEKEERSAELESKFHSFNEQMMEGTTNQKSREKQKRECPVPKPRGIVGEILGFRGVEGGDGKGSKPP